MIDAAKKVGMKIKDARRMSEQLAEWREEEGRKREWEAYGQLSRSCNITRNWNLPEPIPDDLGPFDLGHVEE